MKYAIKMTVALLLVAAFSAPAMAGFEEGLAAYKKDDYATALKEFRPLAEKGNAEAQKMLGRMYDDGEGVAKDDVEAFLLLKPIAVAPERNGFYFWIGLNAPAGVDPILHGRRAIAELGHRPPPAADTAAARAGQELRLAFYDRKIACSLENKVPCLVLAKQNAAQLRDLAIQNAVLLRRYTAPLQLEEFATDMPVLDPADAIPARRDQMSLFALARTLDAVDVSEERAAEAFGADPLYTAAPVESPARSA